MGAHPPASPEPSHHGHGSTQIYCFDLDDTLTATFDHVSGHLYPALARHHRLPIPSRQQVAARWGQDLPEALGALFPQAPGAPPLLETLRDLHRRNPAPAVPGARRILETLLRWDRRVVVFSGGDPEIVRHTLRHSLQLDPDRLDGLFTRDDFPEGKAAPGTLARMLARLSRPPVSPAQVLVVGDSVADARLALDGGARFYAVLSGPTPARAFHAAGLSPREIHPHLEAALAAPEDHGVVAIVPDERGRVLLLREARRQSPHFGSWSGPHGRCAAEDVLEEQTVWRETREECGLSVHPLRPLHTRPADTRIDTVTFWLTRREDPDEPPRIASPREISATGWFTLGEILSGKLPLYPGTKAFFERFASPLRTWLGGASEGPGSRP